MKFRIKELHTDVGVCYYVQRKNKWWQMFWETVCLMRKGTLHIMKFPTKTTAQAWIDKQNLPQK